MKDKQVSIQPITRGELAKQSGKNFETIRFYESKGLIRPAFRDSSNYRRFAPSETKRIAFIDQAKRLGFTLKEISEILDTHDNDDGACKSLAERARLKVGQIERQIEELKAQKQTLEKLHDCDALELENCSCDILENAERLATGCDCC